MTSCDPERAGGNWTAELDIYCCGQSAKLWTHCLLLVYGSNASSASVSHIFISEPLLSNGYLQSVVCMSHDVRSYLGGLFSIIYSDCKWGQIFFMHRVDSQRYFNRIYRLSYHSCCSLSTLAQSNHTHWIQTCNFSLNDCTDMQFFGPPCF